MTEYLFSYGTLQLEKVQLETFGRLLEGNKDLLKGFKLEQLRITDEDVLAKSEQEFHPIAIASNLQKDQIEGTLFKISKNEILEADSYEVAEYKRVLAQFESGKKGWVYVKT